MVSARRACVRALGIAVAAAVAWSGCNGHLDFVSASGSGGRSGSTGSGGYGTGGTGTGTGGATLPGTCSTDVECHLSNLHCDSSGGGLCVECVNDGHCTTAGFPYCDATLHRCVPCLGQAGCASGQTCVAGHCLTTCGAGASACPSGTTCDSNLCVTCDVVGDTDDGACVSSSPQPYCLLTANVCVACRTDSDCSTGSKRLCDPVGHVCVECTSSTQCLAAGAACDPNTGSCVP